MGKVDLSVVVEEKNHQSCRITDSIINIYQSIIDYVLPLSV